MTVNEWLGKNNTIGLDIWKNKYQWNNETFDEWLDRVSGGDIELRKLIAERKIMLGGRTLANRGTDNKASFFNCFPKNSKCKWHIQVIRNCIFKLFGVFIKNCFVCSVF